MEDAYHRAREQIDQKEKTLKETSNKLSDSQIDNKTLKTSAETLRSAMKSMAEKHKEALAELARDQDKVISALKRENAVHIQAIEKTSSDLQRANFSLETETSKLEREKQSLEQRCLALDKLISEIKLDYNEQIKLLTDRTLNAEARAENSVSDQHDLKKKVGWFEDKLREQTDINNQMTVEHSRTTEKLQNEFSIVDRENESLKNQVSMLQDRMELIRQQYEKEKEKMMLEVKQKIQCTELECEELKVSRSGEIVKAKEARAQFEKAVALHHSTIEKMKTESKTMRMELESQLSDERNISQVS